jgi:2-polyprenyl-3-methyl-5-hydroxy-6-metoxy-1,4-benzoquinol methylase
MKEAPLEFFRDAIEAAAPDLPPDFRNYGESYIQHFDTYWRNTANLMKWGNASGRDVLDAGTGYGFLPLMMAMMGARRVVGVDIRQDRVEGFNRLFRDLPYDAQAIRSSATEIDLPSESFDCITSSEMMEHVLDLAAYFRESYRLLRPGGVLIGTDSNNALNPIELREAGEQWRGREYDPDYGSSTGFAERKPHQFGSEDQRPYAVVRGEIIDQIAPDLTSSQREKLVKSTAGMVKDEIVEEVKRCLHDGILSTPPRYAWCRDPITGEYYERLLDPFELRRMLLEVGFRKVRIHPLYWRKQLNVLSNITLGVLLRLLFLIRGWFAIVAIK